MEIIGYSERGIINSIAYFLSENVQYVYEFIEVMGISIPKLDYSYTLLIEQSFSDFGDSDLIIIIENKQNREKIVLFIECKIKTYQGTFQILSEFKKIERALNKSDKITGISSNLFVQLYYKYLMVTTKGKSDKIKSLSPIFKKHNNNPRILGSNKIVLNAFDKIKEANDYYYIAITPTAPNEMDNTEFREKIKSLNLMPETNVHLCYWDNIKILFDRIKARKVINVFEYNNGQIY
jgi:hypothetical protein